MIQNHNRNGLEIIEVFGKEMDQKIIKFMIENRIREYGKNKKSFENNEKESVFFFLKD